MPVYTVHAPVASGADLAATDKFVFVRDGFHFWAAVASVIWLIWQQAVAGADRLGRADAGGRLRHRRARRQPAARSCSSISCLPS